MTREHDIARYKYAHEYTISLSRDEHTFLFNYCYFIEQVKKVNLTTLTLLSIT